jgi:hypothetical protein
MMHNKALVKKVRELWDRQEPSIGAFVGDLLDALERADKENDDLALENLQICGKAGLILDIPRTMEAAKRKEIASSILQKLHAYDDALRQISAMGAVCSQYETCSHKACSDSCGAALTAINVLSPKT